jgi:peptidyl-prolyl cis-trans isomerase C
MRLAAESELGDAWVEHYVSLQPEADYEAMARETYLLNQENMLSAETIDVSHILISTKERSNSEAYDLANTIIQQLDANPDSFDELVLKYSEDPSVSSNQGKFRNVKKGDMVAEFEEAAFALPEGGISTAVQTQYGYHIVRLDARNPVTKASYEEVKDELMASERIRHRDRLQQDYIRSLASMDAIMTKEAMEELVRRLFADKNGNLEQDAELTE